MQIEGLTTGPSAFEAEATTYHENPAINTGISCWLDSSRGFRVMSDGGGNPYCYGVRPPSLINLTILEDMCLGNTVAGVMVILGSIDIVMGEVDR